MIDVYQALLFIHVVAAVASVVLFWVAIALPKGGHRHLATGKRYTQSMIVMLVTAGVLSVAMSVAPAKFGARKGAFVPPDIEAQIQEVRSIGILLIGITVAGSSFLLFGLRAPRHRTRVPWSTRRVDIALLGAPGLAGAATVPFSALPGWGILDGVGLAVFASSALLVHRLVRPSSWLTEHLVGVLGTGIIIHGAVATNLAPRLVGLDGHDAFIAAVPVGAVGVALLVWACHHYDPQPPSKSPGRINCAPGRRMDDPASELIA